MNLLHETCMAITRAGLEVEDVLYVSDGRHMCDWSAFAEEARRDYDPCHSRAPQPRASLSVVLSAGRGNLVWLTRFHTPTGESLWKINRPPAAPPEGPVRVWT